MGAWQAEIEFPGNLAECQGVAVLEEAQDVEGAGDGVEGLGHGASFRGGSILPYNGSLGKGLPESGAARHAGGVRAMEPVTDLEEKS